MKKIIFILAGLFLFSIVAFSQKIRVSGFVYECWGEVSEPARGAEVREKGTTNGVLTDIEGRYTLEVNRGATIVASFIGCDSEEKVVDKAHIDFHLTADWYLMSRINACTENKNIHLIEDSEY